MGEFMKQLKTYTPELREEAVKLVLAQGLTLEEAALRLVIPKGTLANWVSAARRGSTPKAAPGGRTVPEHQTRTIDARLFALSTRSVFTCSVCGRLVDTPSTATPVLCKEHNKLG
jgi:transposase